jgi:glycosyltransferase involved in cell wall biosynthesis
VSLAIESSVRTPRLSIGLPVFNGAKYLARTLDLLLAQDYGDFELIISDNGSTDETSAICQSYAQRDARIRYVRNESNLGATWNFRRVFELSRGEFFKWAASDDECHPAMIRRCMEVIESLPDTVSLVYPQFEFIDQNGTVIRPSFNPIWDHVSTTARHPHQRLRHVLLRVLHGVAFYGIIRTSFLRQTRPFGQIAADWIKLAELAMLGGIVEVPEVLFRYRIHPESSVYVTRNWRELIAWHDPAARRWISLLPQGCAFMLEYLKSVHHLPLSLLDRSRCYAVACTTPPWRGSIKWLASISGPARIRLWQATGWSWLTRGGCAL